MLTVYFDEPFWVGVFEESDRGKLSACRVVFGAEPTDAQIYAFVLNNYNRLPFSPPVEAAEKQKADNPKRRRRNARRQLESAGIGTKSQQALQKQYENNKTERLQRSREQRDAEKQRQFELKRQKRREKHRGR
ncbi:MAG: YjdF family protein [Clostridia bacterium]|nr:YjdF family protein [Clostridia bacterium]